MARSVSYPSNAIVCFRDVSDVEDSDDWEFFVDWIRDESKRLAPSLYDAERWIGREDRAILENSFARIGISEYCGLAAIWIVARDDCDAPGLAANWIGRLADKFRATFGELRLIGRASNGEAFFQRINV